MVVFTLLDAPPTQGDVQMILELRMSLVAEGCAGPAKVVESGVPEPLDPEMTAGLHRLTQERVQRYLKSKRPPADDASTEDR